MIFKELKRLVFKGKKSAEDHYLSKPQEEIKQIKAATAKTERDTYSEEQAEELKELTIAKERELVTKLRLENLRTVLELMKEGLLPFENLEIDLLNS